MEIIFYVCGTSYISQLSLTLPHVNCWSSPTSTNLPTGVMPSAAILACTRNPEKLRLLSKPDSTTVMETMDAHYLMVAIIQNASMLKLKRYYIQSLHSYMNKNKFLCQNDRQIWTSYVSYITHNYVASYIEF